MNQILEFGPENNRERKPKGPVSDNVVRVFAVLLIIFAVVLIGSGIYSLFQNRKKSSEVEIPKVASSKATIEAVKDEANETVTIVVKSEIAISKIAYNWNASTEKAIAGDSKFEIEKEIDLPSGSNTLNIKVIDINGNETNKSFDFESNSGSDIISPNITLSTTEDKKLLITATDETEMAYLTYRWNDEEEVKVEMDEDEDDKTTLSVELEIPKGKNVITIVAVDASSKHNTRTKTDTLTGLTKPVITYDVTDNGTVIKFKCTHENGIKEVFYTLNGDPFSASFDGQEGYPENYREIEFSVPFREGHNRIILTVTSIDGTVEVFDGECTVGSADEPNQLPTNAQDDEEEEEEQESETEEDEE